MTRTTSHTGMPPVHSRLIERPRLMNKLATWRSHRIITISAPPGFGKSTSAAMWLHAEGIRAEWLSLHGRHDDPHEFVVGLIEALRLPRALALSFHGAALFGQIPPTALLDSLLEALPKSTSPRILVVDDAHLAVRCADVLQHLIDAAPPSLHLVLLARGRPPLRTPPDGLHLDEDDLRFDHDEFSTFVERNRLGDLPHDQLADIERRTAGWIIALQLISISRSDSIAAVFSTSAAFDRLLPRSQPADASSADFNFLLEYLDQHVLHGLDARLRSFLLCAALPPEFDASLAAALADVSSTESIRLLNAALEANLLLTMQPAPRTRHGLYRFHPLFRDFLLRELHLRSSAANIRRMQRLVASHFEALDGIDAALDFFLLADDEQNALRLVRERGRRALFEYEFASLRRWLTRLGAERVAGDMELALLSAWLEQLSAGGVRPATVEIVAHLCDAETLSVEKQTEVLTLEAYAYFAAGDRRSAQQAAQRAVAQPSPASPFVDGHRFAMLAATTDPDDHAAAVAAARAAAAAFARVDGAFGQIAPHGMLSDFLRRSGDVVAALRTLEKYVRAFERTHLDLTAEAVIAHLAYAETLYWVDQIAEAKAQFHYVLRFEGTPIAAPFVAPIAQLYLHLCTLAEGDASSVHIDPQVDSFEWRRIANASHPHLLAKIAFLRVTRDVLRNDAVAVQATLDAAGFTLQSLPQLPLTAQLAVLFAEIHAGSVDPRMVAALQHVHAAVSSTIDFELHTRTGLLLAAALESEHSSAEAQELLAEILPMLERSCAHRFAVDCPALLPCLSNAGSTFAARLLLRMQANRTSSHPFNLTNREHEILQLAASGLATDEIAQRINMTRASVYTYFSRIYRKMNVRARTAALHVYRQIEI